MNQRRDPVNIHTLAAVLSSINEANDLEVVIRGLGERSHWKLIPGWNTVSILSSHLSEAAYSWQRAVEWPAVPAATPTLACEK